MHLTYLEHELKTIHGRLARQKQYDPEGWTKAHANELGRRLHTIGKAAGAGVEEEAASAVKMTTPAAAAEGSADKWHVAELEARIRELEEENRSLIKQQRLDAVAKERRWWRYETQLHVEAAEGAGRSHC